MVVDEVRIIVGIDDRDVVEKDGVGLIVMSLSILINMVIYRPEGDGLVVIPVRRAKYQ